MEEGTRGVGTGRRAHQAAARRGRVRHLHAGQHRRHARLRPQLVRAAGDRRPSCCASGCRRRCRACSPWRASMAEPVKSREHILLSTILLSAWQAGESPDLADADPACAAAADDDDRRHGRRFVLSRKDRFAFAMSINALLASPGFEVWSQGEPLDVAAFLRSAAASRACRFSRSRISTTASGCSSSPCC